MKTIVTGLPLRVQAIFWAYTIPGLIIGVVLLAIAVVNPFWFRRSFFEFLESLAKLFGKWRDSKLEPMVTKWQLFNTIKNS